MKKRIASAGLFILLLACWVPAGAQEIRYSWFEIAYMGQDTSKEASFTDQVLQQSVDIATSNGDGIRFRGSFGTWHNLYAFFDYGSTDIDVNAVVTNNQGVFPTSDEFDFTSIRGGVGVRVPLGDRFDLYGNVSYDQTDFDFGSFAGENFDAYGSGGGATLGGRYAMGERVELRAHARYTTVGEVDLNTREFSNDTLFGVGFGFTLVRGLSIEGDYESGALSNWSIGFRLDLDED